MFSDPASELKAILENYDLGELADLEKNERGYINTAFAIETIKDGMRARYFLRKYKKGIREEEIQFEHSLIEHLVKAEACPVARLYKTKDGKTYFCRRDEKDNPIGSFYAIFDFLPGEDRYTWVGPKCTDHELDQSAIVLAQFHQAVSGLQPAGKRAEPKIIELLPVIAETLAGCPVKSKGTVFDDCVLGNLENLQKDIHDTYSKLNEPQAREMVEIVIHCDFHPGNLKFEEDRVTGLFDFDWSKIDQRCFDVALALWYFCASWEALNDGELRLDQVKVFLKAYQQYMRKHHPGVGPLTMIEANYLPYMINASNLYVLNWTILDYYQKDVDPDEYLKYLNHHKNFTIWFEAEENKENLIRTCFECINFPANSDEK